MKVHTLGVCIAVIYVIVSTSCITKAKITPTKKLIIDTDGGGDDAAAILLVLRAEALGVGPRVVAITCVNGNTFVDTAALNILKTINVVNRLDIPVYKGAVHPLLLNDTKDNFFGKDGFGDFVYSNPPPLDLIKENHAVHALIRLVKSHPGELTLLALGPLTNIALAIRLYPSFLDNLQQLIVMGGSVEGHGNIRPGIEFNFFSDAAATYVVFHSSTSKPLILVPFETTTKASLSVELFASLNKSSTASAQLIHSANALTITPQSVNWNPADAVAAAVAITSGSIVTEFGTYHSEAIYAGEKTLGLIIVDYLNVDNVTANTFLVQRIDVDVFKKMFLEYLN